MFTTNSPFNTIPVGNNPFTEPVSIKNMYENTNHPSQIEKNETSNHPFAIPQELPLNIISQQNDTNFTFNNENTKQHKFTSNKIENCFTFAYPANHSLLFSLVKNIEIQQDNKRNFKGSVFFFVTIAPGIGTGSERTYDFKNGKIVQKFSLREIMSLYQILKYSALGYNTLPYNKFSRGGSDAIPKNFSIWQSTKKDQSGQQIKLINITVSNGDHKHTINLSIGDALGLSEYLKKISEKAFEIEFESQNSGINIEQ